MVSIVISKLRNYLSHSDPVSLAVRFNAPYFRAINYTAKLKCRYATDLCTGSNLFYDCLEIIDGRRSGAGLE